MIFILCPNKDTYDRYIAENNLERKDCIMIAHPDDIYGRTVTPLDRIEKAGTFYNYNDLIEIQEYILSHTF